MNFELSEWEYKFDEEVGMESNAPNSVLILYNKNCYISKQKV